MTEADMFLWIVKNAEKVEWSMESKLHPHGAWMVRYRLPGDKKLYGNSVSPSLSDAIEMAAERRTEFGLTRTTTA